MEIIDALKTLYENSDEKVIFTDRNLVVLWRNNDELPEVLLSDNIRVSRNTPLTLPIERTAVCRYSDGIVGYTMKIRPMSEAGTAVGYIIECLDEYDVDKLAMQSMLKERIRKDLASVRAEAGRMMHLLNQHKKAWLEKDGKEYSDFDIQSRGRILGIMSSVSNYEEISIYLGDNIPEENKFMSAVLGDFAERVRSRADKAGFIFDCDVRAMVHAPMNRERFEAAVANLVVNAYMYNSKSEKKCLIEFYKEGGKVILSVTDNGDGIPADKLARLQKPLDYFSYDDMQESLGLTVAMLYCHRFGGRLKIESSVGEYTKVMMVFDPPGKDVPREFRQSIPPSLFATDNTACILAKCFGYFND